MTEKEKYRVRYNRWTEAKPTIIPYSSDNKEEVLKEIMEYLQAVSSEIENEAQRGAESKGHRVDGFKLSIRPRVGVAFSRPMTAQGIRNAKAGEKRKREKEEKKRREDLKLLASLKAKYESE